MRREGLGIDSDSAHHRVLLSASPMPSASFHTGLPLDTITSHTVSRRLPIPGQETIGAAPPPSARRLRAGPVTRVDCEGCCHYHVE